MRKALSIPLIQSSFHCSTTSLSPVSLSGPQYRWRLFSKQLDDGHVARGGLNERVHASSPPVRSRAHAPCVPISSSSSWKIWPDLPYPSFGLGCSRSSSPPSSSIALLAASFAILLISSTSTSSAACSRDSEVNHSVRNEIAVAHQAICASARCAMQAGGTRPHLLC